MRQSVTQQFTDSPYSNKMDINSDNEIKPHPGEFWLNVKNACVNAALSDKRHERRRTRFIQMISRRSDELIRC